MRKNPNLLLLKPLNIRHLLKTFGFYLGLDNYCREHGLYPHHLNEWKNNFLSGQQDSSSKQEQKQLKQEVKRLKKELNRKDKALSETAALLVLSKKCQAIWGEQAVD